MTRQEIFDFARVLLHILDAPWANFVKALDEDGNIVDEELMDKTYEEFMSHLRPEKKQLVIEGLGKEKIIRLLVQVGMVSRKRSATRAAVQGAVDVLTKIAGGELSMEDGQSKLVDIVKEHIMKRILFSPMDLLATGVDCARSHYAMLDKAGKINLEKFISDGMDRIRGPIAKRINNLGTRLKEAFDAGVIIEITDEEETQFEEDLWEVMVFTDSDNATAAIENYRALHAMRCVARSGLLGEVVKKEFRSVGAFRV